MPCSPPSDAKRNDVSRLQHLLRRSTAFQFLLTAVLVLIHGAAFWIPSEHTFVNDLFNPYYSDSKQAELERSRLRKKLATRQVDTVWLQFGSDTVLLEQNLMWLTSGTKTRRRARSWVTAITRNTPREAADG